MIVTAYLLLVLTASETNLRLFPCMSTLDEDDSASISVVSLSSLSLDSVNERGVLGSTLHILVGSSKLWTS